MRHVADIALKYSIHLNHTGLVRLRGHLQAALSAAAGRHFKQTGLLCRCGHSLGTNLLHLLPTNKHKRLVCWKSNSDYLFYSWAVRNALGKNVSELYLPSSAGHDVVNVRSLETIEGGGGCHSVRTHVLKYQPITNLHVRQAALLNNPIQAIAGWAPNTAGVHSLIWFWFLLGLKWVKTDKVVKLHFVSLLRSVMIISTDAT